MADTRYTNDPTRNAGALTTHDPTADQGGSGHTGTIEATAQAATADLSGRQVFRGSLVASAPSATAAAQGRLIFRSALAATASRAEADLVGSVENPAVVSESDALSGGRRRRWRWRELLLAERRPASIRGTLDAVAAAPEVSARAWVLEPPLRGEILAPPTLRGEIRLPLIGRIAETLRGALLPAVSALRGRLVFRATVRGISSSAGIQARGFVKIRRTGALRAAARESGSDLAGRVRPRIRGSIDGSSVRGRAYARGSAVDLLSDDELLAVAELLEV